MTVFDLFWDEALPRCDVLVAADVLYNEALAQRVGERVLEVLERNPRPKVIVTDSQKFHGTDFLRGLNRKKGWNLVWEEYLMKNHTGSGLLVEGDQVYDVKARVLVVPTLQELD